MNRTLKVGLQGADVAAMQEALNELSSNSMLLHQKSFLPLLIADGIFGMKTFARVREFQAKNGLKPDGIVGPMTFGKLVELGASAPPMGRPAGGVAGGGGKVAGSGGRGAGGTKDFTGGKAGGGSGGTKSFGGGSKGGKSF